MRALLIVATLALAGCGSPTEEGAGLYLERLEYETFRAQFQDAHDCRLIARVMQEAEPGVRWYCR